MIQRILGFALMVMLTACGPAHTVVPASPHAPVGPDVTPFVFQSGQSPTDWVVFPEASGVEPTLAMIAGPDGAMWFTVNNPPAIDRISMDGRINAYSVGSAGIPLSMTVGPDGNLWFTLSYKHAIGRVTPSGFVSILPVLPEGAYGIAT